jgi:hypothetical protein
MRPSLAFVFAGAVSIAVPAHGQSTEQVERLAALGQVWGFLKYYHPGVAGASSSRSSSSEKLDMLFCYSARADVTRAS